MSIYSKDNGTENMLNNFFKIKDIDEFLKNGIVIFRFYIPFKNHFTHVMYETTDNLLFKLLFRYKYMKFGILENYKHFIGIV